MFKNYIMPKEFHIFEKEDRFMFFDVNNLKLFVTDTLGKLAVEAFALTKSIDGAIDALATHCSMNKNDPDVRNYVDNLLERIEKIGFLHIDQYELQYEHVG